MSGHYCNINNLNLLEAFSSDKYLIFSDTVPVFNRPADLDLKCLFNNKNHCYLNLYTIKFIIFKFKMGRLASKKAYFELKLEIGRIEHYRYQY